MNLAEKQSAKKRKILILSAPIGSGHRMAAQALEEALSRLENTEVVQGNVFSFFPAVLGRLFLRSYETVLKFCPGLYAMSYRWGNQNSGSLRMRNFINSLLLGLGKSFIEKVKPDLVFSTHATPTGIMSLYKEKYNPHIWLGVVVTDFTVHRWLVCNGVDAYFLADEKLANLVLPGSSLKNNETEAKAEPSFQDKKASGDLHLGQVPQVFACGIPVRKIFSEHRDTVALRRDLRKEFGWEEEAFVCLLVGGGGGMMPMEKILNVLVRITCEGETAKDAGKEESAGNAHSESINGRNGATVSGGKGSQGLHVIAVTGHNDALRQKLENMAFHVSKDKEMDKVTRIMGEGNFSLAVTGFTDEMPKLMQGTDLVITKGGGVSLAECLACGADVAVYSPLPGQEKANVAFVQKEYGVRIAEDTAQLAEIVKRVQALSVSERIRLQECRKKEFGHPDAAEKIAEFTKNLHNIM